MQQLNYKPLQGGDFSESFLMEVRQQDWPNAIQLTVWSPKDLACYLINLQDILESHYLRTGTRHLDGAADGIPLDNIYLTFAEEYEYWMERIQAFTQQGLDCGQPPFCVEIDSHLFANRKRNILQRDCNVGWLIVCRKLTVEYDHQYAGPYPKIHAIPASDKAR
jgi:hypothetical protein